MLNYWLGYILISVSIIDPKNDEFWEGVEFRIAQKVVPGFLLHLCHSFPFSFSLGSETAAWLLLKL